MAFSVVILGVWIYSSWLGVCQSDGPSVKTPVYVREGGAAELSCTYGTPGDPKFTLEWRYAPLGVPAIRAKDLLYFDGQLYPRQLWDSRMSLIQFPPSNGVASLRIRNVRLSDGGVYICDVKTPSDWSSSGLGLINLTVLVPPSWPVCQLSGKTYVGSDVTLQCQSSTGNPRPVYSWTRTNHKILPQNAVTDQISGSLVLRNLSTSLSGTYTCTASNEFGQTTCSVHISVNYASTAGVIGGAVMGVFLLLLLLGALVACVLWRRKKRSSNKLQSNKRQVNGEPTEVYLTGSTGSPHSSISKDTPGLRPSQFSPLV